jgi:exopolysaccharide biosynthesis polyprenyl glycosylphosphotransferase
MRMSQTPDTRTEVAKPAATAQPLPVAREGHGPEESRRRGALLRRLLAVGDWGALLGVLCLVTATSSSTDVADLFWAVLFSPSWVMVVKLQGLYDNDHRRIRHSTLDELPALVTASVLATLVLDGLLALSPAGPLSPPSAIAVGIGTFLASFVLRGFLRFLWHRLADVSTGLVIGSPRAVDMVARRVSTHPETRLALVGYLSPQGEGVAKELPRLGSFADISRIAREHAIERVVVTEQAMSEADAEQLIEECKAERLALTFLPQHYGLLGPGIELNRLAELPVLDFRFSDPPRSTLAMKRIMDVLVSVLLLLALSPLLLGVAIWILLDDGRPVFFRQRRAGKDGEPFTMVKFRTMVNDAEQRLPELVDVASLEQPAFKIPDDPRVTRSGRGLRRTSVDELPQLWNVLRGEMSLVGPRPEEESVVALYDERQRGRLAVKPGMTGPMQVYGRSDLTFEERLAMERDYLDNLSLLTDLAILLRTPRAMVRGEGAY